MQAGTFQKAPDRSWIVVLEKKSPVFYKVEWNVPSPEWRTVGEDMTTTAIEVARTMDGR